MSPSLSHKQPHCLVMYLKPSPHLVFQQQVDYLERQSQRSLQNQLDYLELMQPLELFLELQHKILLAVNLLQWEDFLVAVDLFKL